jgi:ubiquinone/menaquinone biosynthesis C-methylase UbiE
MHERRFHGEPDRLRRPERLALMEVDRTADLALEGLDASAVLDVGTGSGIFAEAFTRRGLLVSGIDANPDMLSAAQKYVPLGDFRPGTAEKLPFADATFDLVFLGHVLHETDRPLAALKEARRVSRRRVAVYEWPYLDEPAGPPLAHRISPATVETLARQAGFNTIESFQLDHMVMLLLE